jgi:O-antigen/teichoic acid export membrane protein
MSRFLPDFIGRRAVVNIGFLFSGSSLARILSAVYIFLLARYLGVDQFGVYLATLSLAKLTSVFFSLGLDSWLLRKGGREPEKMATAVGDGLLLKSALGLLWFVALVGISTILDQSVFPTPVMAVAALSTWLEEIANFAWSAFKATLKNRITVWLMVSAQLLVLTVMLALVWVGIHEVQILMWGRALGFALAGVLAYGLIVRHFGLRFTPRHAPGVFSETLPFALSHGLAMVYGRADITIIAYVLGKTAAGLYGPAVSLTTTLFLIPLALYEVILPLLSAEYAKGRVMTSQIVRFSWGSLFIGSLLGFAIVLLAYPLVWLIYGPEFMAAADVVVILNGVIVLKCVSFALAAVLVAVGLQGQRVWVQLAAAVFNILLNLLIVNTYGIIGVARVYVLTELLLMAGYLFMVVRWQQKALLATPSNP